MDNLFSSPNLPHALREAGHGATGTARPNSGISKELKEAREGRRIAQGRRKTLVILKHSKNTYKGRSTMSTGTSNQTT
jgi:hypothetical protein